MTDIKNFKFFYSAIFLIIFYSVGVAGLLIPVTHELFKKLIPLAILLNTVLLMIFHKPCFKIKTLIIFTVVAALAFLVEALGVKTGYIFGDYTYGNSLGPKLADTPLLIGINWLMLIYCSIVIAGHISPNRNMIIFVPPVLMVIYDLVLEQAAIVLGMWSWVEGKIPARNYIAWFGLSLLLTLVIRLFNLSFTNKLAPYVMVTQFIFFVILVAYF